MKHGALRGSFLVYKWTSLVCTLFLLLLCVTGLPLKALWAILDLMATAILVSGVVLWLRRSADQSRFRRLAVAHGAEA